MNKYDAPANALDVLRQAGASIEGRTIIIKSGTLGLHKLGAVDYLVNNHKYIVIWRYR